MPSTGSRSGLGEIEIEIEYALLDELPALVWAANMAALELHVPQWQVDADGNRLPPDRLVFDLDPGPGTSIVHCCRVAECLRDLLLHDGPTPYAKTSGSKHAALRRDQDHRSRGAVGVREKACPAGPPSGRCRGKSWRND
ncbi:non-homologous end-joining DNA ligase LigD [Amycolatopsis sp. CA-126428]|uniref:non-homologous end-joining DNA ligase LigD n=1 Tax=Amycolatopsis sp. CA-126428 TaxID=2073158 RepID=UPI001E4D9696|nr:hypothetical protein [Amycolatopsis sp. CA-126428]